LKLVFSSPSFARETPGPISGIFIYEVNKNYDVLVTPVAPIVVQSEESAEKTLKPIITDIQEAIEKQKGTFNFTREDSKKTREG